MNPIKKLAHQTAIYGLSSIIGRVLNYLLVPLYTRVFPTQEYGTVTEMYAYVAFLIVILTYGMETAFFRFSETEKNRASVYSTSIISLFFTSSLFILLTVIFSPTIANWIRYPDKNEYVIYLALIVSLDAFSAIPFAKLRAENKAIHFALIKFISIAVNIGLNLFFYVDFSLFTLKKGVPVDYVFIANLASSVVTVVLLLPEIVKTVRLKWFDKVLWTRMMRYAFPLLVAGLAGIINETLDRILLKYLLSVAPTNGGAMSQIGIYGACYKISILMTLFIQAYRFAADPFYFSYEKNKDSKKLYADVMRYFIITVSIIFLVIMMYIDVVILFIGEDFRVGAPVIPILLLANLFLGVFYNLSIWYKLTDKTKYAAYLAILGAIITLALNFYLIPRIGYMGSAWATFTCYLTMMLTSYFIGQKHYYINYDLKRILLYLCLAVALYLFSNYLDIQPKSLKLLLNTGVVMFYVAVIFIVEHRKNIESSSQNTEYRM